MNKITEQSGQHKNLEHKSCIELMRIINDEDKTVAYVIEQKLPEIAAFAEKVLEQLKNGGRLFYFGSGTSGRLGILDASECPPTFGVDKGVVLGIMAGGDSAIRVAVEHAEDNMDLAWEELSALNINKKDIVLGISASGSTPYVIGGLKKCRENGISCAALTSNEDSAIAAIADFKIEIIVGPEVLCGSTRMKAGTAQKMVLNLISTTVMIGLGHVKDNQMIDMKLSNEKLRERAVRMLRTLSGLSREEAEEKMRQHSSVRAAISSLKKNT